MERKLASVQQVLEVLPIENADAIELVRINGWQCVTKKDEFRVGEMGVYLEIDSIPPDTEIFRFLWTPRPKSAEESGAVPQTDSPVRPEKFRIRTMRLRGALSQGLFLPLAAFSDLAGALAGDDVTAALGVEKYEPPVPTGMGDWRAPFPAFVPKTDEMRVQSLPELLEELRGRPYAITLKYDGTSATYCLDLKDNTFHACGRNQSILDGENRYWQMARKYNIEAALRSQPQYAIQGEIVGPGIQKNRLGLKETSLFVFNVYDSVAARYLNHDEARAFLAQANLPAVETLETGEAFAYDQETLLKLAEGKYPNTTSEREGIVIRPRAETFSTALGGRLSFKAISNRFLLKESE
ncbi:MAG: RNA ligase (ATP) [Cytophagales bacterium]|nr:RNA ligase (ATP) [Armatimonadota bacterium]